MNSQWASFSHTFSSSFYLFLRSPRITCETSGRGKGGKASQKVSATDGRNVNGHEHSVIRLSIVLTVPVYPSARYTRSFASPKRFRRLANRVYGWLIGSVRRRWPWSLAARFISPFLFHQRAISSPGCRVDSHLTRTESTITSPRESFFVGMTMGERWITDSYSVFSCMIMEMWGNVRCGRWDMAIRNVSRV